jgi:thiol:disulfide interchange protein DsbG
VDRRRFVLQSTLAACGDKAGAPAPAAPAAKPGAKASYDLATQGHGFATGALMAANTVYVFFDPTCPHCATLIAPAPRGGAQSLGTARRY